MRAHAVVKVRNAALDETTLRFGAMASALELAERFFPAAASHAPTAAAARRHRR